MMQLLVKRKIRTDLSTIGRFFINDTDTCWTLEPKDRGLTGDMSLATIKSIKVAGHTAIPTGTYPVEKYFSPDHNGWVLRLLNVPGFGYVEIHVGNFPKDTLACLLLGTEMGRDEVLNSKAAIEAVYKIVFAALDAGEEVSITYE